MTVVIGVGVMVLGAFALGFVGGLFEGRDRERGAARKSQGV